MCNFLDAVLTKISIKNFIGQQDDLSLGELWFSGLLGGIPKENVH